MICAVCASACSQSDEACPSCKGDPVLQGRYRLEEVIGAGSAGTTYLGTRIDDGISVAIKDMPFQRAGSIKAVELFEREADVLRQISHPKVPQYLDHFTVDSGKTVSLYIVQELIFGMTLAEELKQRRYTALEVLDIIEEIAPVLGHLHGLSPPVIHRDVKPSNILRTQSGELRLIDFGSVRDSLKDPSLGGSTVAGTFGYMAPEQFQGIAAPATDLYALGVTAVTLLARRSPETMQSADGRFSWEEHVVCHVAIINLLRSLLEPDRNKRIGNAQEAIVRIQRTRSVIVPAVAQRHAQSVAPGATGVASGPGAPQVPLQVEPGVAPELPKVSLVPTIAPVSGEAIRNAQRGMNTTRNLIGLGLIAAVAGTAYIAYDRLGPGPEGPLADSKPLRIATNASIASLFDCQAKPGTQVNLRYAINNTGGVEGARVTGAQKPELARCIKDQMTQWQYPSVPGDGFLLIDAPVVALANGFQIAAGQKVRMWQIAPRWEVSMIHDGTVKQELLQSALDKSTDAVAVCTAGPGFVSIPSPAPRARLSFQLRIGPDGSLLRILAGGPGAESWMVHPAVTKCVREAAELIPYPSHDSAMLRVNTALTLQLIPLKG